MGVAIANVLPYVHTILPDPPTDGERYVLTVVDGVYEWYEIGQAVWVGKITAERRYYGNGGSNQMMV